jgi:hypothetical protein
MDTIHNWVTNYVNSIISVKFENSEPPNQTELPFLSIKKN